MNTFFSTITREMHRQDVSMAELARRAGTSRSNLYRISAGQEPTLDLCNRLADALGLEIQLRKKHRKPC